ncbi:hypothetical protein Pcinc_006116 [Petrolisthes cinctipes]|uniref:Uncharacterized protein n=1 Tax=Petrolisthes cinctipes TaxID=88211 RepID=A0AAE1GBE9_PETCI|nr:hypothetical protein Pcinc_006116 [Petrolisthes cinctipes]
MLKLDQERINLEREKLELKKKELEARERESARELEARERELEDRERELEDRERERKHQLSSKQGRFTVKSSAGILAAPDDEYRTSKAMTSASLPPLSVISCGYCKKTGHHITQCQTPGCRKSFYSGQVKFQSAPPTVSSGTQKVQSSQKPKPMSHITVESLNSHEDIFKDFKSSGEVGLSENGPFDPVTILRDTGAAQSILTKAALPGVEENITREKVILSDLSSEHSTELAKVFLKCNLFNKEVKVGIREQKMPISGIQLILGNDLAGSMVVPTPEIVKTPCAHSPTLVEDHIHPEIFPLCAVTRSQTPSAEDTLPDVFDLPNQIMSKENLIKAQREDLTVEKFHRYLKLDPNHVENYHQEGPIQRQHFLHTTQPHHPVTRSKNKKMNKEGTLGEATIREQQGANNATTATVESTAAELISKELSNANLSGEIANII